MRHREVQRVDIALARHLQLKIRLPSASERARSGLRVYRITLEALIGFGCEPARGCSGSASEMRLLITHSAAKPFCRTDHGGIALFIFRFGTERYKHRTIQTY